MTIRDKLPRISSTTDRCIVNSENRVKDKIRTQEKNRIDKRTITTINVEEAMVVTHMRDMREQGIIESYCANSRRDASLTVQDSPRSNHPTGLDGAVSCRIGGEWSVMDFARESRVKA